MMKTHRCTIMVGMLMVAVILLSAASFSWAGRGKGQPALFQELLTAGDHVVISYVDKVVQVTIVTDDDYWRWVKGLHLPVQRGVVVGTFPDYVQIRMEPEPPTLAPAGATVIAHFPYRAIDMINVHVRL